MGTNRGNELLSKEDQRLLEKLAKEARRHRPGTSARKQGESKVIAFLRAHEATEEEVSRLAPGICIPPGIDLAVRR